MRVGNTLAVYSYSGIYRPDVHACCTAVIFAGRVVIISILSKIFLNMFRPFLSLLFLLLLLDTPVMGQPASLTPSILTLQYNRLSFKNKAAFQQWGRQGAGVTASFIKRA